MKTLYYLLLLSCWLIMPYMSFAQESKCEKYFGDSHKNFKHSSPKLLPTDVQNAYDVRWYFLNLYAENTTVALSGDVTISAEVVYNVMDTFSFHLHHNYVIDSILINGVKKISINNGDERLVIGLDLPKNSLFDAQIFYHGTYQSAGAFLSDGISNSTDNRYGKAFQSTWTLSEANNAYHWFPVKQDLKDKADSCRVHITTTKPNMAASNGLLTRVVELSDDKVRYEWNSTYPIAYYLIFIAVAEYQDYSIYATIPQTGESLLIQNFIYNSTQCLSANKAAMDETKRMIEYYSEIFGEYPFSREKYGHALALLGGAMEHQTMTTTGYFYEGIISHELVHQWFGDNVTCASWQHIWLNEGFATYGEFLWNEHKYGRKTALGDYKKNVINTVLSYGKTGSVFVPAEDIDNEDRIFNGILSYDKGSVLLHMLRYELGDNDDLFFNILKTYQNRFKDSVAIAEDFKSVVEELSCIDFTSFFEQWYYGEGYPMFDIMWAQTENRLTLNCNQITTAPTVTPLFKVTFELLIIYDDNSSEIASFYCDGTNKQFLYTIPDNRTIKIIHFDPNCWLLANAFIMKNGVGNFGEDHQITIYPNPVVNTLHVETGNSDEIPEVKIYSVQGSLLTVAKTKQLDLSYLPGGIYIAKIDGVIKKIVKM